MKTKESRNRESLGNAAASSAMVIEENNREADIDVSILPDSIRENYFTPSQDVSDQQEDDEMEVEDEWGEDEEGGADKVGEVKLVDPATSLLVDEINKIARRTVERGQMEIGQFILKNVFEGEIQEVLTRNPNKSRSLRAICTHPDLRVDHRRLGSWVKAAALRKDFENSGVDVSKLNFTHLLALLRVGSPEKRLQLASHVVKKGLSARETLEAVNGTKPGTTAGKGEEILKKLNDPLKLFHNPEYKDLLSSRERMEKELDSEARLRLIRQIDKGSQEIDSCNQFLAKSKKSLLAIELDNLNEDSD